MEALATVGNKVRVGVNALPLALHRPLCFARTEELTLAAIRYVCFGLGQARGERTVRGKLTDPFDLTRQEIQIIVDSPDWSGILSTKFGTGVRHWSPLLGRQPTSGA